MMNGVEVNVGVKIGMVTKVEGDAKTGDFSCGAASAGAVLKSSALNNNAFNIANRDATMRRC